MAVNTRQLMGDQAALDALVAMELKELYEDGVTTVAANAFYRNAGLETVTLPNVRSIGANAFYGCAALTALVLPGGTVCTLAATNALSGTPIADGAGYVYVPDELAETYRAATNWSTYSGSIRALSEYTTEE